MNTLQQSIRQYKPVIRLTSLLSRGTMSVIRTVCLVVAVASGLGYFVSTYFWYDQYANLFLGISMVALAMWLEQVLTFAYHNSYYFRGLNSLIGIEEENVEGATYEVADAVYGDRHDVTRAFCLSNYGTTALIRSGLNPEHIHTFLQSERQRITAGMVMLPEGEMFSLIGLGKYILTHDIGFKNMLQTAGVPEDVFLGSLRWVVGTYHRSKRQERWWSKDNLSRTNGIGQEWTYGTAYLLEKFSRDMSTSTVFSTLTVNSAFAEEKVAQIESALERAKASNVILIGEAGVGKMDLVMEVSRRLKRGESLDAISAKHMIVLDTNRLFATSKDKQELELTLIEMFDEAAAAGNIIIVIENLSTFVREAETMGVFIPEILDQYLALPQIKIIATETPSAFHTHLETLGAFTRRFAEVLIDTSDMTATTRLLEDIAFKNEIQYNILFTYSGLQAITTAANRYIVEGVMPDKAINLLVDVASKASQTETTVVTDDFVYDVVSKITGVPAGPIKDDERDLLLHLEDRLHQQVVGQQRALAAIGRTMRRARAGIQSADKPIGSFLFLGPTGVGKTETAKALANVFFGGESKMQRIDMSEFSGEDALERLIGDGEQAGTLTTLLREHPYCVLLLDEFEKASQPVHDIFLQLLDEGQFTDSRGMRINARNTLVIATSNAGSDLILRTVQQRKELVHLSQEIIDYIVKQGIYRPELINRFDSTIIFEPLNIEQQTEVASLMLGGLYERVKEKGYLIEVTEALLKVLVEKGYNPQFGARPMQRVLQDVIEEKIAQKIISGEVKKGDTIRLARADFTEEELNVQST